MKWEGRRKSTNVNDQRGQGSSTGRRVAMGGGGLGIVGIVVVVLLQLLGGGNGNLGELTDILGGGVISQPAQPGTYRDTKPSNYQETPEERELMAFLSVALADIEDTWSEVLPKSKYGIQYRPPEMTIYSGQTNTACGYADSGVGPFYCPGDQTIYLDLSFYNTLHQKYGAKEGDYAMVYVIAHEAGHHVQTLLGVTQNLNTLRQRVATGEMSQTEFNRYSVAFELQADYLAGVVARYMQSRGYLDRGDLSEAMSAAASVGDDSIQQRYQGYVDPDSFNHGTSAQRQEWYKRGYEAGDLSGWDNFAGL